jgi:hypothetical protein
MKLGLVLMLGVMMSGAVAQQVPGAQAGGNRPGGISFVTRRTSGIVPINNAAALFAAGGVPIIQPAAAGGAGQVVVAVPSTVASAPLDPRAVRVLNSLAARGDRSARSLIAAGTRPRPANAR